MKPEPDFGPGRPEAGNDQNWQQARKLQLTRRRGEERSGDEIKYSWRFRVHRGVIYQLCSSIYIGVHGDRG